jgi:putative DNA primase/helicase
MVFAVNTLPRVDDKTDGYYRRILIVPFERVFKEEEQNKMLKFELVAEQDGIFIWCLEGLKRLRARGYFKESEKMRKEVATHRKNNNSVLLFVEDRCSLITESTKIKDDSYKITKDNLYKTYAEWCKEGNHHPLNKNNFGSGLKALFKGIITEVRDAEARWWVGIKTGDGDQHTHSNKSRDERDAEINEEIEEFRCLRDGGMDMPDPVLS